jgi:hypothetical protein
MTSSRLQKSGHHYLILRIGRERRCLQLRRLRPAAADPRNLPRFPDTLSAEQDARAGGCRSVGGSYAPARQIELVDPNVSTDIYTRSITLDSDVNGLVQVPLLKGAGYRARAGGGGWVSFTTGSDPTYPLPLLMPR